ELERREKQRPRLISPVERDRLLTLGPDLAAVWNAQTTTPRDRKELLRTLIEDVTIKVDRDKAAAHLTLRWKGGALNEIDLTLPRSRPATVRTDEDTIALLRRLAARGPFPEWLVPGLLKAGGPGHGIGSWLPRRPRRQPAPPLGHSLLRANGQCAGRRTNDSQEGCCRAGRRPIHYPSPAQ